MSYAEVVGNMPTFAILNTESFWNVRSGGYDDDDDDDDDDKWQVISDAWPGALQYMNIIKQEAVNNHQNSICSVWFHDISGQMMNHESYPGITPLSLEQKMLKRCLYIGSTSLTGYSRAPTKCL